MHLQKGGHTEGVKSQGGGGTHITCSSGVVIGTDKSQSISSEGTEGGNSGKQGCMREITGTPHGVALTCLTRNKTCVVTTFQIESSETLRGLFLNTELRT